MILRITDFLLSTGLLLLFAPLWLIVFFIINLTSPGSFVFKQKRSGKDGAVFNIYKIRTMIIGADKKKSELKELNEAAWPVFKIKNDPRFIFLGKFLSHTGVDESLQLFNVIKGEMSLVGPRPLPVEEAEKVPKKYHQRFSAAPGITSSWIIKGAHKLSFEEWMESDLEDIKFSSFTRYFRILFATFRLVLINIGRLIWKE